MFISTPNAPYSLLLPATINTHPVLSTKTVTAKAFPPIYLEGTFNSLFAPPEPTSHPPCTHPLSDPYFNRPDTDLIRSGYGADTERIRSGWLF